MLGDKDSADDGILVALIDDRLAPEERAQIERRLTEDDELRARMAYLQRGGLGLAEGFAALEASAPLDRLGALLGEALATAEAAKPPKPASWNWRTLRPAAVAAGLALFIIGGAAGHWLPEFWPKATVTATDEAAGADGWREVVAEYFPLTTTQTLRALPRDVPQLRADLGAASIQASFDLTPERLAVPGLELARVDLFQLDDLALVQVSYLDPQNGPIALCILSRRDAVAPPRDERRGTMNIAWWGTGEHALMLIGRAPAPQLQAIAGRLAQQLGA